MLRCHSFDFMLIGKSPKQHLENIELRPEDLLNIEAYGPVLTTNATQPLNQIELYDRMYNDKCSIQLTNKKIQSS